MTGELKALTSVRGIAAWMVVLFHLRLSMPWLPAPVLAALAKGYLAVDFFFLLSGFVMWLSYHERLRAGGLAAVPGFLRRRIARIWPLHGFILACAALLALAMTASGRPVAQFPFGELPLHLLLLQNWGFLPTLHWNEPAWSISCELGAYLVFPLLVLSIDWRRVPSAAILAAIAALLVLLHTVFIAAGAETLGQEIPRLGLIRCILEFATGTALCALWLRWREQWVEPAAIALAMSAIPLAGWILGVLPESLAVPAAFAAGLLALALASDRIRTPLDWPALHYLGEISYATYLGHYLLWYAFKLAFVHGPVDPALIGGFLLLALASSVALYHLVERPAQRRINALRFTRPLRAPPPAHGSPRG